MLNRDKSLVAADCDICDESLSATLDGEGFAYLMCGHVAHGECLIEHVRSYSTCSVCSHPIRIDSTRGRFGYAQELKRAVAEAFSQKPVLWPDMSKNETLYGQQDVPLDEAHSAQRGSLQLTLTPEFPVQSFSRSTQLITVLVRVQASPNRPNKLHGVQLSSSLLSPLASPPSKFFWPTSPRSFSASISSQATIKSASQQHEYNTVAALLKDQMLEWHGLDPDRLGNLRAWDTIHVGARNERLTQDLVVYLFETTMICVKDRVFRSKHYAVAHKKVLMGNIHMKRHLKHVEQHGLTLTLNLSVPDLPRIYLRFDTAGKADKWKALFRKSEPPTLPPTYLSSYVSPTPSAVHRRSRSLSSSTNDSFEGKNLISLHLVIIYAIEDSTNHYKLEILRDAVTFLLARMQSQDRLTLIPADKSEPSALVLGPSWSGWSRAIAELGFISKTDLSSAVMIADGIVNKSTPSIRNSAVFLISDLKSSGNDTSLRSSVPTYTFGLGISHEMQTLQELSRSSGGIYTYLKDWCKLRECLAGCFGLIQSLIFPDVRIHLRTVDRAIRFSKVSGAMYASLMTGRTEADIYIGSLGPGQVREVLVQMAVEPHDLCQSAVSQDHWDSMVSALSCPDPVIKPQSENDASMQEINMLSVTASYGDGLGIRSRNFVEPAMLCMPIMARTDLSEPLSAHEAVVQRRVELFCADILQKTITLVDRGEAEKAKYLLSECQGILSDLERARYPSSDDDIRSGNASTRTGINHDFFIALNSEMQGAYEGILLADLFARDCKKHLTQCIHSLCRQIAVSMRSPLERHFALQLEAVDLRVEQSKRGPQPPMYGQDSLV